MVQESGDAHMTDGAPKRIWAWITGIQPLQGNAGLWRSDEWTITDDEYILATEHDRIVAEKDAEIARLKLALGEILSYDRNFYDSGRPGYEAIARAALKGESDE